MTVYIITIIILRYFIITTFEIKYFKKYSILDIRPLIYKEEKRQLTKTLLIA